MKGTKKKYISAFVYKPSKENYIFLRNLQTEYGASKIKVGLSRIADVIISKYRKLVQTKNHVPSVNIVEEVLESNIQNEKS